MKRESRVHGIILIVFTWALSAITRLLEFYENRNLVLLQQGFNSSKNFVPAINC